MTLTTNYPASQQRALLRSPHEGLQPPPVHALESVLDGVFRLRDDLARDLKMGLQAGLHGQEPPQHRYPRDDVHGVVHHQPVSQHVDHADDEQFDLNGRNKRRQHPAKRACEGGYGERALVHELHQGPPLWQPGRHSEAAQDEPGLCKHCQDVWRAALELEGLGHPRERARRLVGHALDLALEAAVGGVARQQHVQPSRHLLWLDPRSAGDICLGVGGVGDHRRVGVALLEVSIADPASCDLAGEVVAVTELDAFARLPAVVYAPADPAARLVHVEHLPVVRVVAARW